MSAYEKLAAVATVAVTGWLVSRPSRTSQVIRAHGEAMAGMTRAMMPLPEPPVTGSAEWLQQTEHELMILGHETDCPMCIAPLQSRRPKGIDEQWTALKERMQHAKKPSE